MSESRKNHLTIDGAKVKEDDNEHIGSYRPVSQEDGDFRTSRSSIGKKEKSSDGAEEKLLEDPLEGKITTRVDMTDAKYVVGDHRNGDAKVELDANKKQFSGLTKDELLKYQDDPFWMRLRWFLFTLFWLLWVCMLVGAIVIIVKAPACAPKPKWYEKGPIIDMRNAQYTDIEAKLPFLKKSKAEAVIVPAEYTYEVLDDPSAMTTFKNLLIKAKDQGIKLIVELTPNWVSTSHRWFKLSENNSAEYDSYFVWGDPKGYNGTDPLPPSNWVSTVNTSAWRYSPLRRQFFLQQFGAGTADLNLNSSAVLQHFDEVLDWFVNAGVDGVSVRNSHQLYLSPPSSSFPADAPRAAPAPAPGAPADHTQYAFWSHAHTADLPGTERVLKRWAKRVGTALFTTSSPHARLSLRPSFAECRLAAAADVKDVNHKLRNWPALKLSAAPGAGRELALFSMLLPATPVLDADQMENDDNNNDTSLMFSHLVPIRNELSVLNGSYLLTTYNSSDGQPLVAVSRSKPLQPGYVAVFNPSAAPLRGNLSSLCSRLTLHHLSAQTQLQTNYTYNGTVAADDVLVPPKSTIVFKFDSKTEVTS